MMNKIVSMAIGDYLEDNGAWLPTALGSNSIYFRRRITRCRNLRHTVHSLYSEEGLSAAELLSTFKNQERVLTKKITDGGK